VGGHFISMEGAGCWIAASTPAGGSELKDNDPGRETALAEVTW
jgi:hypothetical protein